MASPHDGALGADVPVLLDLTDCLSIGLKFGDSRAELPLWG